MGWFLIALFVISLIGSIVLAPKPEFENARPGKLGDIKFPRADEGSPVPVIFGKVRLQCPSVLWYGDFESAAIKENQKTGLFSSEDVTVGHEYYVGFDLGLCVGPGVTLERIWCEKKVLWESVIPVGPDPAAVVFHKLSLFGGKKRGGGMGGTAYFYGGELDQTQDSYLQGQLGTDIPAYRGIAHIVFRKVYIGMAPQLRALSFELARYTDYLGLDEAVRIIGEDLNPMEALYAALTESWGGIGVGTDKIDTASFVAAAETLADEDNGISLQIQNVNSGQSIVEEILRQVDGILYPDPTTGQMTITLIREDYVLGDLPVFDASNIVAIENFSHTSWAETINQVRVKFTRRDKKYVESTALAQDMAGISTQGRIHSATYSYPGVTTTTLAVALASRDLAYGSVPLFQATVRFTRAAAALRPGSPFKLTWPEYGQDETVFRIQKFNFNELLDGRVTAEILQDRFASVNALFLGPEDTLWESDARDAVEPTLYSVMESPYWFLQQVDRLDIPADSAFFWFWAIPANAQQQSYDVYSSDDNFVTDAVNDLVEREYPMLGLLNEALPAGSGMRYGLVAGLDITAYTFGELSLNDLTAADVREGKNLFLIDNEIMGYETYSEAGGIYTLENVRRALLDTEFEDHAAGAPIIFIGTVSGTPGGRRSGVSALSQNPRSDTGQLWYRFISTTDQDANDFDSMTNHTITASQRYDRPLPPDYTQIESYRGILDWVYTTATINVSDWYTRNRVTPDQVVFVSDSQDAPESGTTHRFDLYVDDILVYSRTGVTGASTTLTGRGSGVARVEVFAVKSYDSWTPDWVEFFYAFYPNLSAELLTNGTFEGSGTTGWTVDDGSWTKTATAFPLESILPGSAHIQSAEVDSELSQVFDITTPTDYRGNAGVVRVLKGGLNITSESQIIVALLDASDVVLDSVTTPLLAPLELGSWDLLEVPLPIRSDAAKVKVRLIAADDDVVFDKASLRINTLSPTSATAYDSLTGITVKGAWGLRTLVSTYSGPLIKIRDTYDDTETDLYADTDGNLEPFHVVLRARVVKLYDQSGNGADLVPESVSEQPRLIAMVSETGRPAIEFDTDSCSLLDTVASTSRPYMVTRPNWCLVVGPKWGTDSVDWIFSVPQIDTSHTGARIGLYCGTTNWTYYYNNTAVTITGAGSCQTLKSVWWLDHYNGNAYHNEDTTPTSSYTPVDITYPNNTRLRFAENASGSSEWNGYFYELCIFEGDISAADRKTQMESVGLYWHNLAI